MIFWFVMFASRVFENMMMSCIPLLNKPYGGPADSVVTDCIRRWRIIFLFTLFILPVTRHRQRMDDRFYHAALRDNRPGRIQRVPARQGRLFPL